VLLKTHSVLNDSKIGCTSCCKELHKQIGSTSSLEKDKSGGDQTIEIELIQNLIKN
jgi:hypothetical protein